ncbi:MAG TPA: hypothetical protein VJJ52_00445 [Candidatus Nanoarchaeia archaeon]|nr:hypothetical protein [Candidatus Nanoarchaeia archaeon]
MTSDISRVLGSIAPKHESSFFWSLYNETDRGRFAVIKLSGECIETSLDRIAEDLSDLYKLGLFPVVTFGWGNSLSHRLAEAGVNSRFIDGERYTDSQVMTEVERIAKETGAKIVNAVLARGAKAKLIDYNSRSLIAEKKQGEEYGSHNGSIIGVNTIPALSAVDCGVIPIVSPLGISEDGKTSYNINAATAGAMLAEAIDPIKYIMVTSSGGVLNRDRSIISEIVLNRDLERLLSDGTIYSGMEKNVKEAQLSLLQRQNGDDRSVQIVGPNNLLLELFSYRGAGTYIRKGYTVTAMDIEQLDMGRFKAMVRKKLGETLREDWYTSHRRVAYVEKNLKGVATVIPDPLNIGIPYLDIIVVDNGSPSNGVGSDIMTAIGTPTFWRSRIDREPANEWYNRIRTGCWRYTGLNGYDYTHFWTGNPTFEQIGQQHNFVQAKVSNFQ